MYFINQIKGIGKRVLETYEIFFINYYKLLYNLTWLTKLDLKELVYME